MNVPFPFRVAAGVLAVGFDRLRALPVELPALSVSLAGHAVRASMRIQQEITQLAARGDEVLSPLTDRPEEHPAWAHFDDEVVDETVDDAVVDEAADDGGSGAAGSVRDDASGNAGANGAASIEDDVIPAAGRLAAAGASGAAEGGPAALTGYDDLRVTALRARLRNLDETAVTEILAYERAGLARAAFLTTLENRLTSLQSGAGAAAGHVARPGGGKRA